MPIPAALIPIGMSLLGGLFGSRGQRQNQIMQRRLMQMGLNSAQRNYDGRNPFRQASLNALNDRGFDFNSLFDESAYADEPLEYENKIGNAAGAANRAFEKTQNIDRVGNIRQALKDFDTEAAPVFEAGARRIGQRASQFGALGKGTINTELGELGARTNRERNTLQNSLIRDSEERGIDDAFRSLSAAREGQRIEQDQDNTAYARAYGERDRRTGLRRTRMMDRSMLQGQNRAEQAAQLAKALGLGEFGFGNDPANYYIGAAGAYGQGAQQAGQGAGMNWSVLGQLLAQYFGGQGGGMQGTPSPYAGPSPNQYG